MKKNYIYITLVLLCITLLSCEQVKKLDIFAKTNCCDNYVTIKNDKFHAGDSSNFFPIMMNYMVQLRLIEKELVMSPTIEYDSMRVVEGKTKEEIHERLRAHFQTIKDMGFNSLRLVGLNGVDYDTYYPEMSLSKYDSLKGRLPVKLSPKHLSQTLNSTQDVIDIAKESGLRVMILLPKPRKQDQYNFERLRFIKAILSHFSEEKAVFAYDFFNEPLYFDNSEYPEFYDFQRRKEEAYRLVSYWKKLMNKYAPNQLFTIGFAEPIEVFEWDPSILPVDFVTFHTYGPLRVPNEIYWYANYINKPWMLGETSLPADNDSITYDEQAIFMKDVLQRVINCGGQGIGWWQYQDVLWGPFEHNYTALVNHEGKTTTSGGLEIDGSIKAAGKVLQDFEFKQTGDCDCKNNYYNILGYKNYKITGTVINDETGDKVEGAVIRGWTEDWGIGANTFTNADGEFELYSNKRFANFEISAPGLSTEKFQKNMVYIGADESNLEDTELEYHSIHYQKFLQKNQEEYSTFNFEGSMFNKYKLEAEMKEVRLSPINLEDY